MQRGLVVGYTNQIMLHDCKFIINRAGQARVRAEKRKNVHAFISGYVSFQGGMGTTAADSRGLPATVQYNPYKFDNFVCTNLTEKPSELCGAECVIVRPSRISAAYTY